MLLRYEVSSRTPVIKQLPWLPEKRIASMCFDPTMTWLLIATETSEEIYIIPALSIVVCLNLQFIFNFYQFKASLSIE